MKPKKKALVIRPAAAQEMVLMKSNSFHMCLQKIKTPLGYSPPLRNQRGREAFVLQHEAGGNTSPEACGYQVPGLVPSDKKASTEGVATSRRIDNGLHIQSFQTRGLLLSQLGQVHVAILVPRVREYGMKCRNIPRLLSIRSQHPVWIAARSAPEVSQLQPERQPLSR